MKEKVLIRPYFESIFFHRKKNIQLKSIQMLPPDIQFFLDFYLKKMIALHHQKIFPVSVKPLHKTSEKLILIKDGKLTPLKKGEFFLLILPTEKVRYIFQTVVEEEQEDAYVLRILDPRTEQRYKIDKPIFVFLSYIPEKNFSTFLSQDYFFVRDVNLSQLEDIEKLEEIYFFDLILNHKEQLDDFVKIVSKVHLKGELVDISRGGLCVRTSDWYFSSEGNYFFYVRFQIELLSQQILKFGLLCHLRNFRQENNFFYLHLKFFISFDAELWEKLIKKFKMLS